MVHVWFILPAACLFLNPRFVYSVLLICKDSAFCFKGCKYCLMLRVCMLHPSGLCRGDVLNFNRPDTSSFRYNPLCNPSKLVNGWLCSLTNKNYMYLCFMKITSPSNPFVRQVNLQEPWLGQRWFNQEADLLSKEAE